tara:strand:+ start:968 stop:1324 length:357 start_codon:yes stop_codon:yes gene_type:complete
MANSPSGLNNLDFNSKATVDLLRNIMTLQTIPGSSVYVHDTVANEGDFYAITAVGADGCIIDFTTTTGTPDARSFVTNTTSHSKYDLDADLKLASGTTIFVQLSKLVLKSGQCVAYKR